MNYQYLANELRKKIQVLTNTFEAFNLQVLNIGAHACSDDDGDLEVLIEIASINGSTIPDDVTIKLNLYDESGSIYLHREESLYAEDFGGYDTIQIDCYDDKHTLERATRGRLFVTK